MIRSGQSVFSRKLNGGAKKILIKIPSEAKYIKKVSAEILNSLSPYKVDEDGLFAIRLCVEEAVRNAIVHGNRSDRKLPVRIDYSISNDNITIEIEDKGSGFDHKLLRDPTEGDNILRNSGRGVYLMKKLMDSVEFNEAGNKIKMIKRFK